MFLPSEWSFETFPTRQFIHFQKFFIRKFHDLEKPYLRSRHVMLRNTFGVNAVHRSLPNGFDSKSMAEEDSHWTQIFEEKLGEKMQLQVCATYVQNKSEAFG